MPSEEASGMCTQGGDQHPIFLDLLPSDKICVNRVRSCSDEKCPNPTLFDLIVVAVAVSRE